MQAMVDTGEIEAVGLADPSGQAVAEARRIAPAAEVCAGLDDLLRQDLDGVVIATPSALHARQTIRALEAGVAVFCQKPLGRDAGQARRAVDAARQADRLLAVDLSYRFTEAAQALRTLIRSGDLGRVFAADLTFHNAYGPDKGWFYDPALSGGGCLMDLGVHLVDLALWLLDETGATILSSTLLAQGRPLRGPGATEDYAVATLVLAGGAVVRIACSWKLPAGQDAVISASLYGDAGGAELRNLGGSFYDLCAERFSGTARSMLACPPDDWGGRAARSWASALAAGRRFDPEVASVVLTAGILDRIYQQARRPGDGTDSVAISKAPKDVELSTASGQDTQQGPCVAALLASHPGQGGERSGVASSTGSGDPDAAPGPPAAGARAGA
jgi:predicted dehydrogenase